MKKKNKPSRAVRERRSARTLLIIGFILILFLVGYWTKGFLKERRREHAERNIKAVRDTMDGYHFRTVAHRSDRWWADAPLWPDAQSYALLEAKKTELLRILHAHSRVSPEARRIAERCREILPCFYLNGQPVFVKEVGKTGSFSSNVITVCFISKDAALRERAVMPLWVTKLDAVVIPAIEIPEPVYAAAVFHELGHALRHNKLDGRPDDAEGSDAYVQEETEMHLLTGRILDDYSHGAYRARVEEIVQRTPRAASFDDVLERVTPSDLESFQAMFGCLDQNFAGELIMSQAMLDISYSFCDAHGLGMSGKMEVYRWFERNIFAMPSIPSVGR